MDTAMAGIEIKELIMYSKPTKFDHAPLATVWRMVDEDDVYSHTYIQVGDKETDPHWITIGELLTKAFQEFVHDDEFMKECIRLFIYNNSRPLLSISNLIKKKEKEFQ